MKLYHKNNRQEIIAITVIILSVAAGILLYLLFHRSIDHFMGDMQGYDYALLALIPLAYIAFRKIKRFVRKMKIVMKYPHYTSHH